MSDNVFEPSGNTEFDADEAAYRVGMLGLLASVIGSTAFCTSVLGLFGAMVLGFIALALDFQIRGHEEELSIHGRRYRTGGRIGAIVPLVFGALMTLFLFAYFLLIFLTVFAAGMS